MIETTNTTIVSEVKTIFDSYETEYSKEQGYSIVVHHFGAFSQDLIHGLAMKVEDMMLNFGDKKHIVKRMFSILIEGLQNIRIHGGKDDDNQQLAFILLGKSKVNYKVLLGNIVEEADRSSLKTYLGNINSHGDQELKELYRKVLVDGYLSRKGGAGLGVITMRLKSDNELKYRIYNLSNGKTFFAVEVELTR